MSTRERGERFADIEMLRYRLRGFEELAPRQRALVYCLAEATLWGRDITFDQHGRLNLRIRKALEAVYTSPHTDCTGEDFKALSTYLRRVWFSNGIHHHYSCAKMETAFSPAFLENALLGADPCSLPLRQGESPHELFESIRSAVFDPGVMAKRVNKADGEDIVATSACNFYDGVTQAEAEAFYAAKKAASGVAHAPSFGLNTQLAKENGRVVERTWHIGGMYGEALRRVAHWLRQAVDYAEGEGQRRVIEKLLDYYATGNLSTFDDYCVEWVACHDGSVDFVNGFIEVYGDPLGLKGTWEGIVHYRDDDATRRTQTISENAQWFEDHSPVDARFRKPRVKGVTASAVRAAMLGGDEYPSTAIGINLPNADWIRAEHGSKSVTITNLTEAYADAARDSGLLEEFVPDERMRRMMADCGHGLDDLHTDLHECLGHGSGQLLPGTAPDALKAYGNTIEEARADLFALYFIADAKMVELGLVADGEAYKAQYYSYMLNGLLTQLARIEPGAQLEEAHMRNRALIARWCVDNGDVVTLNECDGKTSVCISDYGELRTLFGRLLAEVQRIKSEGDYEAARRLVEDYGVAVDPKLHGEVRRRYARLGIAPYKGFINPQLTPVMGEGGRIEDVEVDYSEQYDQQMLRYSRDYSALI